MKINRREGLGLFAAGIAGFASAPLIAQVGKARPQLFFNGDILTMEGDSAEYIEALVEQHGRIVFAGALKLARAKFPDADRRNLRGRTLLPGFIDGHGHLYIAGLTALMANILPPPDGPAANFDSIVATTQAWMESPGGKSFIKTFGWIVANGYDDAQLAEKAHPTADLLDRISIDLPVLLIHQSGHVGCLNHKGLAAVGYSRDTVDPKGGVIRRNADGSLAGLVEEAAYNKVAYAILARTTPAAESAAIDAGQAHYLAGGYTTAMEARALPNMTRALEVEAKAGRLMIDVIAYPDIVANAPALTSPFLRSDRAYFQRYRIGGAKLSLDGAPQAKTAWLTKPYEISPEGVDADYRGYPAMTDAQAQSLVAKAISERWQLLCHANGDAAIDQFIGAVETATAAAGKSDHRAVLVHGQTLRADQVSKLAQQRILPSLFPAHTYYWGDHHRLSVLGDERAKRISPCRDVLRAGLTLTSHHDAPVIAANAMRVLDASVNRTTRSGYVLGADQRLTPYEGLRTLTAWAAIQCFEEATKGTLTVGKVADLVVLSANPLKAKQSEIHQITVLDVFKDGNLLRENGKNRAEYSSIF